MADPDVFSISFRQIQFWGGLQYFTDGWYLRHYFTDIHRIFAGRRGFLIPAIALQRSLMRWERIAQTWVGVWKSSGEAKYLHVSLFASVSFTGKGREPITRAWNGDRL